jgi:predicted nucleic acid-binding protein
LIYIDTSAFLKLVLDEPQSPALRAHLAARGQTRFVSSALLKVEARRGLLRGDSARMPRADLLLGDVTSLDMSAAVLEKASRLPDSMLRSLDAIHLATALLVRDDLDAVLTYDDRLATAAASHGLTVESPGLTP